MMNRLVGLWVGFGMLCIAGCGGGMGRPGSTWSDQTKTWAEEVALGTEYGGDGPVTSRWTHPVRLSVMSGNVTRDLNDVVTMLNGLLSPSGISIQYAPDNDATADVQVYFSTLDSFDGIAQAHGFQYVPGNFGFFYMFWDGYHRLTKSYVLLATDRLQGEAMRHFTFEEVTQSFGLANDSPIYPDSIFYANGPDGGGAQTLSPLDQKLVRFVYEHVEPGSNKNQFDAAYDAYWN